jgi:hypothetical protein
VITGKRDTYLTVAEFAAMIGRDEKTVRNWSAEGRLRFVHLCGVPLISLRMLERLIEGVAPERADDGLAALKLMNRADRDGRRAARETRRKRSENPASVPPDGR